ncbi:hypothetical protein LINPERPRIM_LOCUS30956 [Linum perenne]
MTCTFSPI